MYFSIEKFHIGKKIYQKHKKTLIIAEAGSNHNRVKSNAFKLIDAAKKTNCDAVKFQKRTIDKVYTQELLDSPRESPWGTTQREQKEALEFSREDYKEIQKYCQKKKVSFKEL